MKFPPFLAAVTEVDLWPVLGTVHGPSAVVAEAAVLDAVRRRVTGPRR